MEPCPSSKSKVKIAANGMLRSMIRGMIRRHIVFLLLTVAFGFAGPCYCQDRADRAALVFILDAMRRGHLTGSFEYWGRCGNEEEYVTRGFPMLATPKNPSAPPLQVLREMFADDEDMQVTQDPDGTIRMAEKTVPQDLLNVKIGHISFDDEQKKEHGLMFDTLVMDFITGTPEVKAFMKDHGISFGPKLINRAMSPHPGLSGELNNVTLAQALDYMLKTFRGLWIYEECRGAKGSEWCTFSSTAPNDQTVVLTAAVPLRDLGLGSFASR